MMLSAIDNQSNTNKEKLIKIYQRHKKDIYLTAHELLKDHQEAEDIVQTVIINLSSHLDKMDNLDNKQASSYIIIATRNCCFDILRKKKGIDVFPLEKLDQIFPELFSNYDNYFKLINNSFELSEALNQTTPDYADIVTLRYFQEYSIKEIAEILSITENNVSVRLSRALTSLKKIISEEDHSNEKTGSE